MKRRILSMVFLLLLTQCIYSQELILSEFEKFTSLFPDEQIDGSSIEYNKEIPNEVILEIFGSGYFHKDIVPYSVMKFIGKEYISVILEKMSPAGGYSSIYNFVTFSKQGKIINDSYIGSNMLDADGGKSCKLDLLLDSISILRVTNTKVMRSQLDQDSIVSRDYDFYDIHDGNYKMIYEPPLNYQRKYDSSSYSVLNEEQLLELDLKELDIMRNEIFASHGYIFKTQKWKEYFSTKIWYIPKYDDVKDSLNQIERLNIENILKVVSQKRSKT